MLPRGDKEGVWVTTEEGFSGPAEALGKSLFCWLHLGSARVPVKEPGSPDFRTHEGRNGGCLSVAECLHMSPGIVPDTHSPCKLHSPLLAAVLGMAV